MGMQCRSSTVYKGTNPMSTKIFISQPQLVKYAETANLYAPSASVCLLLSDFLAVSAVFWFAVWTKHMLNPHLDLHFYMKVFPSILIFLAAFFLQSLYPAMLLHPAEEMRRTCHAVTAVIVVLVASTFFLRRGLDYSRYVIALSWVLVPPVVLLGRVITRKFFSRRDWWPTAAVVLGAGPAAQQIARSLNNTQRGLRVTGVLLPSAIGNWDSDLPPVIGHLSDAPMIRRQRSMRYAILAMPESSHAEIRQVIQDHCKDFRHILIVTGLLGICCVGISPREIAGQVGLEIPQRLSFVIPKMIKRCMDCAIGLLLFLLLIPMFLIICAAIKMTSKGPVFFRHLRYGRDGKAFRALKFRTMDIDADRLLADYLRQHPEQLLEWQLYHKLKKDPRITRVGRWLRRYSLDELPQLINILTGHMSLVGPRPIVESEIKRYATTYDLYTRVPPGLTGLWQVSGRNNTTYEERVAFDDYYVRNWSIWMDMYILARTFRAVFHAEGAY
jgi:Undecaprenyl-phosphate galactose phosphotransferase WbaP